MKILMFGRGVIATLYGWALEKAGHSLDFYVRPGRAAEYGSVLPLKFYDARAKLNGELVEENWKVRMREDLPAGHDYDLIIVSVQHYRFDEVAAFLGPRAGKATILIFNNLWKDPQAAASALPRDQLAWGFPMAGGGFERNGVLSGALFHKVEFGTFGADPTERELKVRRLFRMSGFKIKEHRDFKGFLLVHFAINAGLFTEASVAGSVKQVMESPAHWKEAVLNVRETLPVLEARGVNLKAHADQLTLFRLPARIGALLLKVALTFNKPLKASVGSHANQEEERRRFHGDMLDEMRRLGISAPRFEAANARLSQPTRD